MRREKNRRYWIIAKRGACHEEVLTIDLGGREALPVFRFEEEAAMFLWLQVPGSCWRVREASGGELISLLCGPFARVGLIALDPLPSVASGNGPEAPTRDCASTARQEEFVEALVRTRASTSERRVPPTTT
jgi:hypothetical protein